MEESIVKKLAAKSPSCQAAIDLAVAFDCIITATGRSAAVGELALMLALGTSLHNQGVNTMLRQMIAGMVDCYAQKLAFDDGIRARLPEAAAAAEAAAVKADAAAATPYVCDHVYCDLEECDCVCHKTDSKGATLQ